MLAMGISYAQTAPELVKKAQEKAGKKDYKGAVALLDKAIAINPNVPSYYFERAICMFNSGAMEEAKTEADKIPALFPDSIGVHLRTGIFFYDTRDFDHAIEVYDGIFNTFPTMPDSMRIGILNNRGSSKHSMNDAAGAKEDYDIAYAIDSMNISIMINLAGVYDDLGKPEESVRLLLKVIKLQPNNNSTYNNLGFIYNNMGKYKEAIDIFNKSIDLIKKNKDYESQVVLGFTYSNRGHAKYKLGDNKGALKDFELSIELAPSNSYVFKNRALVYIAMNKNKEACLDLYRAISLGFADMYGNEVEKLINAYCR